MSTVADSSREPASILGPTLRFKGELRAEEDLLIKGHIEGSIVHTQRLTICREGQVKADIQGQIIAVEGTVEGDLTAAVSVSVVAGANVTGDIHAPSVSIVEGASINGSVVMEPNKSVRTARAAMGRQASSLATDPVRDITER
jgi:cytoskeletal protein CcmA (bactofilin family)